MHVRSWVAALLLLSAALPAGADVLITKKVSTGEIALLAKEAQVAEHQVWFGDGKLSDISADESMIVDLAAQRIYFVDHRTRTFSAIELPLDLMQIMPAEFKPMIEATVKGISVEVTPTEETRTINEFPTKKYVVNVGTTLGMHILIDSWVTRKSPVDVAAWKELSAVTTAMSPMLSEAMEAMDEVDGFPILQEVTLMMMGTEVKSREEVLAIETKDAPAGTYAPPEGYVETPPDPARIMRGG